MSYTGRIKELPEVLKYIFKKDNETYSNQLKDTDPYVKIDYNIYGSGPTMGEYVEEQIRTHSYLKWRIFYPLLWLRNFARRRKHNLILLTKPFTWFAKKQIGKYYLRPFPDNHGFTKIKIVDRAFELALMDVAWYCLVYKEKGESATEEDLKKAFNSASINQMRELKDILMHIVKNDTYYIDFMNMFALRIATEMNKAFPANPAHIIWTKNRITDFGYFHATLVADRLTLEEIRAVPVQGVTFHTKENNETSTAETANKL